MIGLLNSKPRSHAGEISRLTWCVPFRQTPPFRAAFCVVDWTSRRALRGSHPLVSAHAADSFFRSQEARMDAARIFEELTHYDRLPEHALRAASAERHLLAPEFIRLVERFADGGVKEDGEGLLLMFHLLGEWGEKSAYPPILRLLRRPSEELDIALGDAVTRTSHRVVAATFDGDPAPLYDLILDPAAGEYVRSRMCEVLPMVAVRGLLPRADAVRFLEEVQLRLEAEPGCFVWNGWQGAIAMLGLSEAAARVKDAFDRGMIDPSWLAYTDFEDDLDYALAHPEAPHGTGSENTVPSTIRSASSRAGMASATSTSRTYGATSASNSAGTGDRAWSSAGPPR